MNEWIAGGAEAFLPRVTLTGRSDVTVEGHGGLFSYETGRIRVRTALGVLTIEGEGLVIDFFGGQDLSVRGRVDGIRLEGEP